VTPEHRLRLTQQAQAYMQKPNDRLAAKALYLSLQDIALRAIRNKGRLDIDTQMSLCNEAVSQVFERLRLSHVRELVTLERYMGLTARRLVVDHIERQGRIQEVEEPDGLENIPDDCGWLSCDPAVAHCLKAQFLRFCDEQPLRVSALEHLVIDQLDMSEIAKRLGRTQGAAAEFISQCRMSLRRYLSVCRG
jgi:DNA-directed RNA polymerase specialized sigma24 family protein